ncbi:CRISPR-associated endonuclease Cas2 [Candidatus Kaiserbacteria bacterium RIFCSPLOWO2_12_FULL_53_8]|uniref:CRISPR-associated endonuclease Cas2 n=2 Tax=Candidatus Kaiseribacteriota TaxID=1752734 RepID=A0A1F6CV27_9BACT|nr:MAG: CRISPR-associated endonuclease Cas2 [Candidatus Kaiserbacteria bacterium RIFCSPHIGHO2_01_FULL_53_29]OGG91577.1 MAG: CRISPR-associated endonuclease Cas2 [Candidatus Kaiserbacteria bacterium RIFCSPLOWO2_12_FULL_53_8]
MKDKGSKYRRRQLGPLERDILEDLTLGDVMYAFLLSARSTRLFYKLARERAAYRYRRKRAIERLIGLEYIQEYGERLSITSGGCNALEQVVGKTFELLRTAAWDRKWRIVVYDIPEKYSVLRDKIRAILKRAGFMKLQNSVWIFPHECKELVQLIKQEPKLAKYILYGRLDRIEGENDLKKLFQISS